MNAGTAQQLVPDPVDPRQLIPLYALREDDSVIELNGIPMPPSGNNVYATLMLRGRPVRVKSKPMKLFERDAAQWALRAGLALTQARVMAQTLDIGTALQVDCLFHFHRKSVLTLTGRPKRNDTANRLKPLHDSLSGILGIDDCHFWNGSFEKLVVPDQVPEHVTVRIQRIRI